MNRPPPPKVPLLVVIPFWAGDQGDAIELCKLLCGFSHKHAGQEVHVMLAHRWDCPVDPNLVKIVSAKFNVLTHQTRGSAKGWPAGCNAMFASAMIHVATMLKNRYVAVYWMEPDAIPIVPDWSKKLIAAWNNRHPSAWIVGCRHDCNGDGSGDHITGCALYDPEITRLIPQIVGSRGAAWDYEHRAAIVRNGQHTHLIANLYKARNVSADDLDQLLAQGCVIVHGAKDDSVKKWVKLKYSI